ncbi:aldehyde dehydrogenase family protein [Gulosibacter molinativorax]|uniref:Aldehyde dehydrogenase n=1 Tax=Gulosibacter molinativorax TaxID=256821 RepID=A0ABT7C956_9MICO|nr:aldehyde dehydrogenase family protein [Gulosibacter molinativorax]MDJ1371176.1 aldehyde dehydrogenase [Gulosibacter molinativorax]QUY62991.1 Glutarate-semialdehyde dehydrogenase DavD [Gulosibacter molinativorax]
MSAVSLRIQPHLYIAGEYTDGSSTERSEVINPATGESIASVPVPTQPDLDLAVAKAHEAQPAWRRLGVFARAEICHKIGDALEARAEELARIQTSEQGKPLAESLADITEAAHLFHLHAEDAVRLYGETLPSNDRNMRQITWRAPIGVFGIITPWNFPMLMFAEFVAPGLATGNAHVVKPPANTPLTVLAAMEVMREAGLPDGLVSVLPGDGELGASLVSHPGINAVGFIGSSATAAKIQATAGLKPLLIEASGNGPVVVLADADAKRAAKAAVDGAYSCSGQVCCATERVIVHQDIHDEFVREVLEYSKTVVLGDPTDPNTNLGPLNNEAVAAKMDRHMADARERGFDVLVGGGRAEGMPTNLYYEFTVVDGVTTDSLLSREESFGPVVPIITAKDDEDALRIANDDPLGLQGAVFTESLKKAFYFMEEMQVGQVIVNESNNWWDVNMPFGGAGGTATGWGRIGGMYTLHDMTYLRNGCIRVADED